MQLRELLGEIGRQYDPQLDFNNPAQRLLRASAFREVQERLPVGYIAKASGGLGNAAEVPWVAVFDPDETTTARRGMYVVYLFNSHARTVYLSLAFGVTEVIDRLGRPRGREHLRTQAKLLRSDLSADLTEGLVEQIDLGSRSSLPRDYEACSILARRYDAHDMPSEEEVADDLSRMLHLYEAAVVARTRLLVSRPGVLEPPPPPPTQSRVESQEFKPKDDADYRQIIVGRTLVKTRKHETLVKQFGEYLHERGFVPATNVHPRDLTADGHDNHWLIEAKIVRGGNGVFAAREALSQLFFYRYFLYSDRQREVRLLALFNEPIGDGCTDLLEQVGISSVWRNHGRWVGSHSARAAGLTT